MNSTKKGACVVSPRDFPQILKRVSLKFHAKGTEGRFPLDSGNRRRSHTHNHAHVHAHDWRRWGAPTRTQHIKGTEGGIPLETEGERTPTATPTPTPATKGDGGGSHPPTRETSIRSQGVGPPQMSSQISRGPLRLSFSKFRGFFWKSKTFER